MRNTLYLRNFGETIARLAEAGHEVTLGLSSDKFSIEDKHLDNLLKRSDKITAETPPDPKHEWGGVGGLIRNNRNYYRFLEPELWECKSLRKRTESRVGTRWPKIFKALNPGSRNLFRKLADPLLSFLDDALPPSPAVIKYLKKKQPDLICVTPLVDLDSEEVECVKAANQLGIPTVLAVASWDNLSNKGIVQGKPDYAVLWNEIQQQEAIRWHGFKQHQIIQTGAQLFDNWFDRKPYLSREDFCKKHGFDPSQKIVTYLCSSVFISRREVDFTFAWASLLRYHPDELVSGANILIRPHPNSGKKHWAEPDLKFQRLSNIRIYPIGGEHVLEEESRNDYFDTLYHSDVVVGINTSAFLEAGIVDTPCLTIVNDFYRDTQDGTIHFHYLIDGGLVQKAESFKEHGEQLKAILHNPAEAKGRARNFVKSFIRPCGLGHDAQDELLNALTDTIPADARGKKAWKPGALHALARACLGGLKKKHPGGSLKEKGLEARKQYLKKQKEEKYASSREGVTFDKLDKRVREDADGQEELLTEIHAACASKKPIIIGPFLGEVGYELLYWIPFLRWFFKKNGTNPAQVHAISRGGCAMWYQNLAEHYYEILEDYTPKEFLYHNELRIANNGGIRRQSTLSDFDQDLLDKAADKFGLKEYTVVHPRLMYALFRPFTQGYLQYSCVGKQALYQPFTWKNRAVLEKFGLEPGEYTCVKFYYSDQFTECEKTKQFVNELLTGLLARGKVVLLSHDIQLDDHRDVWEGASDRLINIKGHVTPQDNLAIQTALIAESRVFYGTYGGFAYLAPLYGINSINFFNETDLIVTAHLQSAEAVFNGNYPFGNFLPCHVDDWMEMKHLHSSEEVASV